MKKLSILVATLIATSATAQASDNANAAVIAPDVDVNQWQFELTPYAWAAANEGKAGPTESVKNAPDFVDISFGDLAEELDFGTMLNFKATKDDWVFFSEVTVLNVADADVALTENVQTELEISGQIIDAAVGYRFMQKNNVEVYGFAGVRYFNLEIDSTTTVGNIATIKSSMGDDFVDPFVGVHAKWQINKTFALQGRVEVGGLVDEPSENTLMSVTIDHKLTDNWSMKYFYRAMKVNYEDNGFTYDMEVTGPGIGATYKF